MEERYQYYINNFPGWHPEQGTIVEWSGLSSTRVRPTQIVPADKSQWTFAIAGIVSTDQGSTAAVPIITDIQMEFLLTTMEFRSTTTTTTMEFHSTTTDQDFQGTEGVRGSTTTCEAGGTTSTTAMELKMLAGRSFWGMGLRMEAGGEAMDLADRCNSCQSGEIQFVSSRIFYQVKSNQELFNSSSS